ncbi:MAG TPA: heme o synthase [Thermoplasmata archaeon]|jgi:protoheme IX farnesyltransferase|nr:heme o synthase [Thermoplasmata archaeon]
MAHAPDEENPSRWRDVVTLTKPGITALIVLVAVAGYFLALPARVDLGRLGLLALTGGLASAGSAMLNHVLDRDVDGGMKRTRGRPLPGSRIKSSQGVLVAGIGLVAFGVGGATLWLNPLTGLSIALGALTYVVVYTLLLKRRTNWNIVIGGFAGSAPALAGGAAAVGSWTAPVLAFSLLVFLWTPPHFWSLALLLREDYRRVGLPMLPRMDDPAYSGRIVVVSALLLVPASVLLVAVAPFAWPAALLVLVAVAIYVALALPLWRRVDRPVALRAFIGSGPYLLAVIAVLVVNFWLHALGIAPL